jgi:Tfp pilus assembly PilM family ATPase
MESMKCSFFQPPEFLTLPFFGLSISQTAIKLTKLKKRKEGYVPSVIDEVVLKERCEVFSDNNEYSDCRELKKSMSDLQKKYKIKFVQLAIPEENTYVFRIVIPSNTLELIEEFITNNLEQYIPLAPSEVYFDYKILKSHITDTNIPVVVTAIPRIVIEKYTNLLELCGICTIACEPETHAIARSVIQKGDNNPYIIININNYATNISVVEEGLVQYTQTLPIKTHDVVQGMTPEIATAFKDSINKVIIYWFTSKEQHIQNSKIENIILTGEGIDTSDIVNFLESNLFVNATFANVWKNCFDIHEYVPSISKKDSLKYATCIGLSLFKLK